VKVWGRAGGLPLPALPRLPSACIPLVWRRIGVIVVLSVAFLTVLLPYPWSLIAFLALMGVLLAASYVARRQR
jgi:hypothetical protein